MKMTVLHPKAKKKGKIEITDKKIITGKFRLSYPALFEAKEFKGKKSWSISMIFSKDTDLTALRIAAQNAAIEKWGNDPAQWPTKKVKKNGVVKTRSVIKWPFRDGDVEKPDKPEYENAIFVGASCKKRAPGVIDKNREDIVDESDIKAGDYCRASLIAFAFENEGSYGVAFTLLNVQKLKDGEALGGGRGAASDFADAEDIEDDEDEENDEEESDEEESDEESDEEESDDEEEEDEDDVPVKKKASKKTSKKVAGKKR